MIKTQDATKTKGFADQIKTMSQQQAESKERQQRLDRIREERRRLTRAIYDLPTKMQTVELNRRVRELLAEAEEYDPEFHKRRSPYGTIKTYWHCYSKPKFTEMEVPFSKKLEIYRRIVSVNEAILKELAPDLKPMQKNQKIRLTRVLKSHIEFSLTNYLQAYPEALIKLAWKHKLEPRHEFYKFPTENLYKYIYTYWDICPFARLILNEALDQVLSDKFLERLYEDCHEVLDEIETTDICEKNFGRQILTSISSGVKRVFDQWTHALKEKAREWDADLQQAFCREVIRVTA